MIDSATKDRILEAAQIVDVVSEFVTLRKRGVNYVGLCPFHADKNPSFYVSPAKNLCKCFACGEVGSPVYFIMKHEQLSYPDALRYLARKYHIEIRERELTDEERRAQGDRESMFILNNWAQKYFTSCLMEHEEERTSGDHEEGEIRCHRLDDDEEQRPCDPEQPFHANLLMNAVGEYVVGCRSGTIRDRCGPQRPSLPEPVVSPWPRRRACRGRQGAPWPRSDRGRR